jgi:hypothetical protein
MNIPTRNSSTATVADMTQPISLRPGGLLRGFLRPDAA